MDSVEAVLSRSPWHLKRFVSKITELVTDKGKTPHKKEYVK
jgi:hypothetical protein